LVRSITTRAGAWHPPRGSSSRSRRSSD
jgi:hypothetical protein